MVKDTGTPTEGNPGFASQKELDDANLTNGTFSIDADGILVFTTPD